MNPLELLKEAVGVIRATPLAAASIFAIGALVMLFVTRERISTLEQQLKGKDGTIVDLREQLKLVPAANGLAGLSGPDLRARALRVVGELHALRVECDGREQRRDPPELPSTMSAAQQDAYHKEWELWVSEQNAAVLASTAWMQKEYREHFRGETLLVWDALVDRLSTDVVRPARQAGTYSQISFLAINKGRVLSQNVETVQPISREMIESGLNKSVIDRIASELERLARALPER